MADDVVTEHGPLFDGQAEAALRDYMDKMPADIASQGQKMVRDHLSSVLRRDLGVYTGRVSVRSETGRQVIENTMVYSPWLEGVSERNRSTRFKGYHTFRIVGQELDDKAGEMAEEILQPYLREMNE